MLRGFPGKRGAEMMLEAIIVENRLQFKVSRQLINTFSSTEHIVILFKTRVACADFAAVTPVPSFTLLIH